ISLHSRDKTRLISVSDQTKGLAHDNPDLQTVQRGSLLEQFASAFSVSHGLDDSHPVNTRLKLRISATVLMPAHPMHRFHYCVTFSALQEKLKPQLLADLPNHLDLFDRYLSKRTWLSGEKVDYPDFNLYDMLDTFNALEPTCLDNYPRLKKYLTDF
ncbi:glutathione S-transferase protein, partial [Opisthorchis viverrini]